LQSNISLRLKGAGDPESDRKYNESPYLNDRKFKWNGYPQIDFAENVLNPFQNALGALQQNGSTLLQTVQQRDRGGVLGNPARAAAPADVVANSNDRNVRAFSVIMNYIDEKCEMYLMFQRDFTSNGIAVWACMLVVGPLPAPPSVISQREDQWARMTMDTLRIPYDFNGYCKWIDVVSYAGRKLGKDGNKMKDKYISGLPSNIFQSEKTAMTHDNTFLYPPTYGMLPGYAMAANAATNHPYAGQADHRALGMSYSPDWMQKTRHIPKQPPTGYARSTVPFDHGITFDEIAYLVDNLGQDEKLASDFANLLSMRSLETIPGNMSAEMILGSSAKIFASQDGFMPSNITVTELSINSKAALLSVDIRKSKVWIMIVHSLPRYERLLFELCLEYLQERKCDSCNLTSVMRLHKPWG